MTRPSDGRFLNISISDNNYIFDLSRDLFRFGLKTESKVVDIILSSISSNQNSTKESDSKLRMQ